MTKGYYAIPPRRPSGVGRPPTTPWPYCRECTQASALEPIAPITDDMNPSIRCRACKRRLREWK
jgi:hypothetical protein